MQTFQPDQLIDRILNVPMKFCGPACIVGFVRRPVPHIRCWAMDWTARVDAFMIKDMLENNRIPDERTVKHIDRCLSCLYLYEKTCPSGCIICI